MEVKGSSENDQQQSSLQYQVHMLRDQQVAKAPLTLLEGLESRISQYKSDLAQPVSAEQLQQALLDERWEVRCSAVERLDSQDIFEVDAALARAFQDEYSFVRIAALRVLAHKETATSRSMLMRGLHDEDWQVREATVQALGDINNPAALEMVASALQDDNAEVRAAAQLTLRQHEKSLADSLQTQIDMQSTLYTEKKENYIMQINQLSEDMSQAVTTIAMPQVDDAQLTLVSTSPVRKKRMSHTRVLILVATLVLAIGVLTAAAGYTWWNYQVGNPDLYATINQQVTSHGITIKITKVYTDEGHTIIAYDVPSIPTTSLIPFSGWKLTGSAPQVQVKEPYTLVLTPGSGEHGGNDHGVNHLYLQQLPFRVPAGVNTLTIHFDITKLEQFQPTNDPQVFTSKELTGNWDFTFTVPFHHTNNTHIPNPVSDGSGKPVDMSEK